MKVLPLVLGINLEFTFLSLCLTNFLGSGFGIGAGFSIIGDSEN